IIRRDSFVRNGGWLNSPHQNSAANDTPNQPARQAGEQADRYDYYHSLNDEQNDRSRQIHRITHGALQAYTKAAGRRGDEWLRHLQCSRDCGKRRLILEETTAAFEAFDLGSYIRQLALHVESILNLVGLFHYFQELRFQGFLFAQPRFKVEVFFRDVLPAALLGDNPVAGAANLFEGCGEL